MTEEKEEGEVQKTSGGSSVAEGGFSRGIDGQISEIEKQLKCAQATLFDLQKMRENLEMERAYNSEKAKIEKELKAVSKIKEENEKLKDELKGYHSEIDSLKDIIGTLKDDLISAADKLQNKVAGSIKKFESTLDDGHIQTLADHHSVHSRQSSHHSASDKKSHVEEKPNRNFFSDHLDKEHQPSAHKPEQDHEAKTVTVQDVKPQEAAVPAAAIPIPATDESKVQQASPQMVATEATAVPPVESKPEVLATAEPAAVQSEAEAPAPPVETIQASLPQDSAQPAQQLQEIEDGELDEYEDIKRELEALENESMFRTVPDESAETAQVAEASPTMPQSLPGANLFSKKPVAKPEKTSLFAKIFKKKSVPQSSDSDQPLKNSADYKKHFWGKSPADKAEVASETPALSQPASNPSDSGQDQVAAIPAATAPEVVKAAEPTVAATANVEAVAEPKTEKQLQKLVGVFKKRKKGVKQEIIPASEIERGEHSKADTGTGKLLIKAAVFLMVVFAGGIAYRINNADSLRSTYTSKATEALIQTVEQTPKAPEGFSGESPEVKYKEAFIDLSFENTLWNVYRDNELGVQIEYPQNTSYRLKPIGSNQVTFLRKEGYLMKIERVLNATDIKSFADTLTASTKYQVEELQIKGNQTLHLLLQDDLPVKGNIYVVNYQGQIYKIWYKTYVEAENPDDEKRVRKMLDTLDFIPLAS